MSLRVRLMNRLWSDAESVYRAKVLASLTADSAARLLDVGCDDGAWTEELRRRIGIPADQVWGIEIEPARARLARERGFHVRTGDLEERWPIDDGTIDVLHANQVIEHIKRVDHFAEEARRVLARSGVAVICTENLASWHNVAALVLGYQPFSVTNISRRAAIGNPFALHIDDLSEPESWQHIHVLTLRALRDLLTLHGFVVERMWGAGYHPFTGRLGVKLAEVDPRHAHFIGVVARARD